MFRQNLFNCFFSSTLLILSLGLASGIYAQEESTEALDVNNSIEEIIVTGSRIKRAGFETLQPANLIEGEFLEARGIDNVAEIINESPVFAGIPGNSDRGGQGSFSIGQNFVNAFGLGSARTLTLINGRRVVSQNAPVSGSFGKGGNYTDPGLQVDLNIIPTKMIDRIESIYTGGAPIYGSDAIAGTVNIILKDNFEGFSFDAQAGTSDEGGADHNRIRAMWGSAFGEGRGHIVITAETVETKKLDGIERQIVADEWRFCSNPDNTGTDDGIADNILCKDALAFWQVPETGAPIPPKPGAWGIPPFLGAADLFNFGFPFGSYADSEGNSLLFSTDGQTLIPFKDTNVGTINHPVLTMGANGPTNPYYTSESETNTLITPVKRDIFSAILNYEISENVSFYGEVLYAESDAIDTQNQPWYATGIISGVTLGGPWNIPFSNPYLSDAVKAILVPAFPPFPLIDTSGDGAPDERGFWLTRSNFDLVSGTPNYRSQKVSRVVLGLDGEIELFGETWQWDTSLNFGKTSSTSTITALNAIRYALAIDAVTDPSTGNIVCRSQLGVINSQIGSSVSLMTNEDISQCTPMNPFGSYQNGPELNDYLFYLMSQSTDIKQRIFEANISGNGFEVAAGPIGLAAGVTVRREKGAFNADELSAKGIPPNVAILPTTGRFDTKEIYLETVVPIYSDQSGADLPGISSIQLEGAIRQVDNNIAGSDQTWTAGARMSFQNGFQIRGNFTQAIRSPSVAELFMPESYTRAAAADPCDFRYIAGGPNSSVRQANCQAEVASLISQGLLPSNFDLSESNFNSLIINIPDSATIAGDMNLQNEISDSWTIGFILKPDFIPGLTLSIDWTEIELTDAVISVTGTQLMNTCYDSPSYPSPDACSRFRREANTFQVKDLALGFLNAANREMSGLLINLTYTREAPGISLISSEKGLFGFSTSAFQLDDHRQSIAGTDLDVFTEERGFEEWRGQANFTYQTGPLSLLWQILYTSGGIYSNEESAEYRTPETFGSSTFSNFSINWEFDNKLTTRLVVNNVFDEIDDKYLASSRSLNSHIPNGNNFRDVVGRRYSLEIGYSF